MSKRIAQNHPSSAAMPEPDLQTMLRGGLRGRFARSFSVLTGAVDTLERYLATLAGPDVQSQTAPLLHMITQQVLELERLADNAAELALDVNLHAEHPLGPVNLTSFLRTLCASANEELARLMRPARVALTGDWSKSVFVYANEGLMNVLFANLFSNSVRAKPDARITLECAEERRLLYRDNGPGLSAEACALLQGEAASSALARQGGTGLLLAAAYAAEMHWTLTPGTEDGLLLTVELPPYDGPILTALHSTAEADRMACQQAACLRREFEATLF